MAEAILSKLGDGKMDVYSAGSKPMGQVNPYALELLDRLGYAIDEFKSEHLNEFLNLDLDYVITVCDNANNECPVFAGNVKKIHWGMDDPAAFEGDEDEKRVEFQRVYDVLEKKIKDFVDFFE